MKNTDGWKWRALLSFVLLISLSILSAFWRDSVDKLIMPGVAAHQVDPSAKPVMLMPLIRAFGSFLPLVGIAVLAVLWAPWARRAVVIVGLLLPLLTGCGPARVDVFEDVGPNDTAFVTPLTGDNLNGGQKFNSVQYLDSKKVSAKRIAIPLVEKNTGRAWWDYEWIPAVKVWKVKRTLVSKEWTSGTSGTKNKDEGIPVVTADAIKLSLGVAVTTFIEETDAATYLYYHGEAPLEQVTDNNVRNYCVTELTREYGQMTLAQAKTNGAVIFSKLYSDATNAFKPKGITIMQLGNAEGFEFKDPKVQEAINSRFIAEQKIATQAQEKLAQDEKNKQTVATAQAQADAAQKLMAAKEATTLQNQLDVQLMLAKAQFEMAQKWDGRLPANILPSNSPLLMSLGAGTIRTNAP